MTDSFPLSDDARTWVAELYNQFAEPMAQRLRRRYYGADPDLVSDAVIEAIMAATPGTVDLVRFLYTFARQRLRIVLRGDTRRRRREEKYSNGRVTDGRTIGPSPADRTADRELAAIAYEQIARTSEDRTALDLWLQGVTEPVILAEKLGYSADESGRQQAVRIFARIRKRCQRERDKQLQDTQDGVP